MTTSITFVITHVKDGKSTSLFLEPLPMSALPRVGESVTVKGRLVQIDDRTVESPEPIEITGKVDEVDHDIDGLVEGDEIEHRVFIHLQE